MAGDAPRIAVQPPGFSRELVDLLAFFIVCDKSSHYLDLRQGVRPNLVPSWHPGGPGCGPATNN
jgi:hypothetical protein